MPETAEKGRFFGNYFAKKRKMRAVALAFSAPLPRAARQKKKRERTFSFSLFPFSFSIRGRGASLFLCKQSFTNIRRSVGILPSPRVAGSAAARGAFICVFVNNHFIFPRTISAAWSRR